MSRMVSFIALLAIIAVVGALFYRVMAGFLLPLFLAVLLVVIFRPVHQWILVRCKGRNRLAAALTTLAILLIVLVPLTWISILALVQGVSLVTQFDTERFQRRLAETRRSFGLEMPLADELHALDDRLERLHARAEAGDPRYAADDLLPRLLRTVGDLESALTDAAAGRPPAAEPPPDGASSPPAEERGEPPPRGPVVGPERAEAALASLAALRRPLEELWEQKLDPHDPDLMPLVQQAQLAYRQFTSDLLGGPLAAFLRQKANPSAAELRRLNRYLLDRLQAYLLSVSGAAPAMVGEFLLGGSILVLGVYFFFADGPKMIEALMRLSPLDPQYVGQLLEEFDQISRSVVVATLLTALAQGLLAGVGYYFAGLHSVVLLTAITAVVALVPFVGATAAWFPVCVWLFFIEDRVTAAVLLFLYGFFIVSTVDNVLRPLLLQGQAKMHPLLALLSIIGGVQALGPIGILVGPMLVAFLQALLKILHTELGRFGAAAPG